MTSIEDDDIHNKIIAEILKACTDGCTEQNIIEQTHFSHDQLRRIMAEIVDRELLHYIYTDLLFFQIRSERSQESYVR